MTDVQIAFAIGGMTGFLITAGSMVVAEIERLDRREARKATAAALTTKEG